MDSNVIPNYADIDAIIRRLAYQYFWKDADQYERALTHPVSWLVAGAPFLAESDHPARWAATNLGTVMNAKNNPQYFRADKSDDLTSRLAPVLQNDGIGKPDVMKKIQLLLELILLTSYQADIDDDKTSGNYNALSDASNPLNYDTERARIVGEIDAIGSIPEVDELITVKGIESIALGIWWYQ